LLIGFASEDDWLNYGLENDPRCRGHDVKIEAVTQLRRMG
jgi:hypothetical protein